MSDLTVAARNLGPEVAAVSGGAGNRPTASAPPRPVTATDAKARRKVVIRRANRTPAFGRLVCVGLPDPRNGRRRTNRRTGLQSGMAKVLLASGAYLDVPAALVFLTEPDPKVTSAHG